jgi:hypothetical protein
MVKKRSKTMKRLRKVGTALPTVNVHEPSEIPENDGSEKGCEIAPPFLSPFLWNSSQQHNFIFLFLLSSP